MSSFVVRIDDIRALLRQWKTLLTGRAGPTFTMNEKVLRELGQWPRIKWFYYCDDQDGNTIRLYDTEHMSRYSQAYYLEPNSWSKEHYERVILRGKRMWHGAEANLKRMDSLRVRFRRQSPWRIFGAQIAPIRSEMPPLPSGVTVRAGCPPTVDIRTGTRRELRLWYFEALNQLPSFDPAGGRLPDYEIPDWPLEDFEIADDHGGEIEKTDENRSDE
jgi:hypothetical protein